jgi:U5 small nuclear ribonucleoprotein component
MDQYDEFGNYIGPEDEDDLEDDVYLRHDDVNESEEIDMAQEDMNDMDVVEENRIILHEDKKYYPDAEEIYPGVRTVTLDEDAQDLNEPIIKPVKPKVFSVLESEAPALKYEADFMTGLMSTPSLIRNVVLLGQFHHGKSCFADILVQSTHQNEWEPGKEVRYSDSRKDEQDRQLSIKSTLLSLVLDDLKEKSYLLNIIDTPGHINFTDEATAGICAADGAIIVVDAVEGVMMNTERLVKQAVAARLAITLVINKMDRLILELKLPPHDAYFKLVHTIEEVNGIIASNAVSGQLVQRISPELGNVCFASAQHGWSFTLDSFAQLYVNRHKSCPFFAVDLGKRLWGDWYLNQQNHSLTKSKPKEGSSARTFVSFILEPLYKIYAQVIGETPEDLMVLFRQLGIRIKGSEFHLDPRPLLALSLRRFFGPPQGFVSMVTKHIPSPVDAATTKIERTYSGLQTSVIAQEMKACASGGDAPFMGHVMKLYNSPDGTKFYALTRIFSGSVRVGQRIKVLGEAYTEDDDEDMSVVEVTGVAVSLGRFNFEITSAVAGNLVLLSGIDQSIKKTATLCDASHSNMEDAAVAIFAPLRFDTSSVIKLAVEPFIPSELPKMVEALRRINKTYPLVTTKVEESGEHIILGTGELYMDCIMHDLRHLYSDIEIKVADPVVSFCETVAESSSINCITETPNKKNTLTFLAEPLDDGLADDIERHHRVSMHWDAKRIGEFFRSNYDWDLLTARSVWAFGPEEDSPNILLNNTLPSEVNQSLLTSVKDNIVQGFRWGAREGPLCDEPIRNVKFRVLDANVASEAIYRGGGQIIPTARRAVYSSFLMGTPRLMEPMLLVEIQAPADAVQALYPVLARRRGHIVQDIPKPGAPFYTVKAFLPAMDSFGFETDLRSYTLGQVFCQQVFDHWSVVPGDPLDKNVILHPLEPSPPLALARDFMVKTRRRKGLSEDVSVKKYLDDSMLRQLARHEAELGALV